MSYVTLNELKAELGVALADTTRDASMTRALNAASGAIDSACGRRFTLDTNVSAQTFPMRGRVYRDDDGEHLLIPDIGSSSGVIVETGSGSSFTTVASTNYELAPCDNPGISWPFTEIIMLSSYWPTAGAARARITARWGWPAVPASIVTACLILSIRLWKRRDSPEGVVGSAEWGAIRVSRTDADVESLIAPYRRGGFA